MKNGIAYHLKIHNMGKELEIVAFDGRQEVGFCHATLETYDEPGDGYFWEWSAVPKIAKATEATDGAVILHRLQVDTTHHRRGIGSHLLRLMMREVWRRFPFYGILLEASPVNISNPVPLKHLRTFYQKTGFRFLTYNDRKDTAVMYIDEDKLEELFFFKNVRATLQSPKVKVYSDKKK